MSHDLATLRKPALGDRRPPIASRITNASLDPRGGAASALRQRLGNQATHARVGEALQAKLTIGTPGDAHEREADRVADAVMRMPAPAQAGASIAPPSTLASRATVQRLCTECEEEQHRGNDRSQAQASQVRRKEQAGVSAQVTPAVASDIAAMRGGGNPLPPPARAYFEPRFGADFAHVRVHDDARAHAAASAIGARAFTIGRDIAFARGQYAPASLEGQRLLAHELTHVLQQRSVPQRQAVTTPAASQSPEVIQRAGDPARIPPGLRCPTDLGTGRPAGTDIVFGLDASTISAAHTAQLTAFRATWLAGGGTDDILVHGYASTDGDQGRNWTLSCDRAEAVQAELVRLGIPAVRISVVAHGESTDFGPSLAANRHAVVTSRAGILPLPLATGVLTARDNFAGRSTVRFGVGEIVDLSFLSLPPRPAADFGGLTWVLAAGGGALAGVTNAGTATYTAPALAGAVRLELRVAGGATAGRVVSSHAITIVIPSAVRMVAVAGTAPSFSFTGPIPAGTWGAGFQANVFVDPKDVSFQGVVFGEGTVASVVTPAGGFQGSFVHPVNTFGPGHGGNAATGTPVSPPVDNIISERKAPSGSLFGKPTCGTSDFLWAIPWEFSVAGGPRTRFAGGFTANHHATSSFFCNATIEKAGAGPFCRRIDGTTC